MKLPAFDYAAPATLDEAVSLLAANPDAKAIAGGQSLLPVLAFRLAQPSLLVDLRNVPALDRISIDEHGVTLGAKVRWCDIEAHEGLRAGHPLLARAVEHVAHYAVRNRGTVGGSLAHADAAAELPCIAVTCDAEIVVVGSKGSRTVKAADFFVGPLTTVLGQDELVTELRLPAWPTRRRWAFEEFARQRGAFALAGVALYYDEVDGVPGNARIGVLGASACVQRLTQAEAALEGRAVDASTIAAAAAAAAEEIDPIDDPEAGAEYRRSLVAVLVERCLVTAQQEKL